MASIKTIGNRITYGGQAAKDQRVYYVNLLNITGNKFGSSNTETIFDPVYGSVEITFNLKDIKLLANILFSLLVKLLQ